MRTGDLSTHRRLTTMLVVTALAVTLLAGCDNDPATSSTTPAASATTSAPETGAAPAPRTSTAMPKDNAGSPPQLIDVTGIGVVIEDGTISPDSSKVEVDVGEPILLYITADQPGALRLHAGPDQSLAYDSGETTIRLTFDNPGVVRVDDHETDQVVVQLKVRSSDEGQ